MAFADERTDLLRKLHAERAGLLETLRPIDDAIAGQPTPDDEWSVKQQLAHLATAERLYATCVRRALAQDAADTADLWPASQTSADFAEATQQPLPDLIADVAAARADTIQIVENLTEADWNRRGANTPFGDLTVGQFLKSLYRHDRMHIDQISGREPTFKPQVTDPNRSRI